MKIQRYILPKLKEYASQFRSIAIMGIRQSGKTTASKLLFSDKGYANFENLDVLTLSQTDPRGFLNQYITKGAIFDEIQKAPVLFNYLQEILDKETEKGKYILTGSSNFLLNENISQSLAGRIGFIEMYPFSYSEILEIQPNVTIWEAVFKGGFPEIWAEKINPIFYYPSYIQSFIEKDVRQLIQSKNLIVYQQFVKLLASRVGQELNLSSLGQELGIDSKTINSWVSYLQIAGIIYLLPPYFSNFGKRIIKRPKLYFTDTGIVSSLIGIQDEIQLENHPLKGNLFENFVVMEFVKNNSFNFNKANFYYWRTVAGIEIDLLIEKNSKLIPVEIKSGMTYQESWWKNIKKWQEFAKNSEEAIIIYNGIENYELGNNRKILNYSKIATVLN